MFHRFTPPGAQGFLQDLPKAQIHFVNAGHFALESNLDEIAGYVVPFLKKTLGGWKKM